MAIDIWNAKMYSQFLESRTRPAQDLLNAIPAAFEPNIIYDLGCGPGNSTILLKNRWPNAQVVGLDSSSDMLAKAKNSYPNIDFINGDIAHFSPKEKIDCLFANASFQWLDKHETLIPNLLRHINPSGMFAIQIPNNFHCPSHQVAINLLQTHPMWQPLLKNLFYGALKKPLYYLPWYYDVLTKAQATSLQLWETTYFQEMSHHEDIFNWINGTGLRPVLSMMDADNQSEFMNAYIKAISTQYPIQENNKILLPYQRIFMTGSI